MKESLRNNTKIKLISIMSSIFLWMYVMAVVDPEESRTIENISVRIENQTELEEANLMIYPNTNDLTSNLTINGNLSNIKSITKNDIVISGRINNPIEGVNEVYLSASTPQGITHRFKDRIILTNLEKVIEEEKEVEIIAYGKYKDNVESISIENEVTSIKIIGPRSLVEQVDKIEGYVDISSTNDTDLINTTLSAVDIDGNTIDGVSLSQNTLNISVIIFDEVEVPIKLNVKNQESLYDILNTTVSIRGEYNLVHNVEFIETVEVDIEEILSKDTINVSLESLENIYLNNQSAEINISDINNMVKFEFEGSEIDRRDNDVVVPDKVTLVGRYDEIKPTKSQIKLYIDNDTTIKFESDDLLSNVSINPKKAE